MANLLEVVASPVAVDVAFSHEKTWPKRFTLRRCLSVFPFFINHIPDSDESMSQQFPNPPIASSGNYSPQGYSPSRGNQAYGAQAYGAPAYGAPPPKKKGLSVVGILGIVFGIMLVAVLACGGLIFFAVRQMAVDSTELVVRETRDGVASLQLPKNWTPLTGAHANPEASLQMGNLFAETYALVLSETKVEVSSVMGDATLDEYSDLIINNMVASTPGFSGTPKVLTPLNGMPAYHFQVRGTIEGNPVVFFGVVIEGKQHFHQVLCWTLRDRETTNKAKLDSVIQSFREL